MKRTRTLPFPDVPSWSTMTKTRWRDGRVLGVDGSMWLYRAVPLGMTDDARSPLHSGIPAEPLLAAGEEIATLAGPVRITRRATARSAYRDVHFLLVNLPRPFEPAPGDLTQYHRQSFPGRIVNRRVLLLGVRLVPKIPQEGLRHAVRYAVETMVSGGSPLEDYARDHRDVDAALSRCGLRVPTADEILMASRWWTNGSQQDAPYLVHPDHLHMYTTPAAAVESASGPANCASWPASGSEHTLSFATSTGLDLPYISGLSSMARYVSALVQAGAVAISIRGRMEPAAVTRDELRRMRKKYLEDVQERYAERKMSRSEQEETLAALEEVEAFYSGGGSPSLVESSTVVAFPGRDPQSGFDFSEIGAGAGIGLVSMVDAQEQALAETMLASSVRSSPHLQDLPIQTIAYSGIPGLSKVGDVSGALVGFTERDGQPAYMDAMAATDQDTLPLAFVAGGTGSGKSQLMMWLADQFARQTNSRGERRPVIIFDPSPTSDLSQAVERSGGVTVHLDQLLSADGIFDPLRYAPTPELGVEMACSMLMSINPWGSLQSDFEVDLQYALGVGVAVGASCVMQALRLARDAGAATSALVDPVERLVAHSPMARAVIGSDPSTVPLRTASGLTYIRVGNAPLNLPVPGSQATDLPGKVAMAVVRAVAFGSVMALTGREGVFFMDEGWVFTQNGAAEMDRIGRLARKQGVFPVILSQRITDAVTAGLSGYISRGLILALEDADEARAACELFRLEPTPERLKRIRGKRFIDGGEGDGTAFDWNSLMALVDRVTRKVTRGSIGIYCDVAGRAAPVEITIPAELLAKASTNRLDMAKRDAVRPSDAAGLAPDRPGSPQPQFASPEVW